MVKLFSWLRRRRNTNIGAAGVLIATASCASDKEHWLAQFYPTKMILAAPRADLPSGTDRDHYVYLPIVASRRGE